MHRFQHRLLLCTALLVLTATAAQARPKQANVAGLISSVSSGTRPALVTIEGDEGPVTLKVTARTQIRQSPPPPPGTEPATGLDLLEPGLHAEAAYDPNSRTAIILSVAPGEPAELIRGTLTDQGTGNLIIVVTNVSIVRQLALTDTSRLYLGPTRINVSQLPLLVGLPVEILSGSTPNTVGVLRARLPQVQTTVGRVASLDPAGLQLSLQTNAGVQDLKVAAGVLVDARGLIIPLEAIEPEDRVRVSFVTTPSGAVVALAITALDVNIKSVTGQLTAVNPDTRIISVRPRKGAALQISVPASTPITFAWDNEPAAPAPLAELAAALPNFTRIDVQVEYLMRGDVRIATRIEAQGVRPIPPPPPAQ
jgi:hypothetical protein